MHVSTTINLTLFCSSFQNSHLSPPPRPPRRSIEALTVSNDEVNVAVITFSESAHVDSAFNSTFDKTVLSGLMTGPPKWIWAQPMDYYTGHWGTDGNPDWICDRDVVQCPNGNCYRGNKLYCHDTNYAAALDLADEVVNSAKYGARANVSKLVVMVADGNLPCKTSFYEDVGCNPTNLPGGFQWCGTSGLSDILADTGRTCYAEQLRTTAGLLPSTYAIGVGGAYNRTDLRTLGAVAGSKVLDAESYDVLATETSQIVSDIILSELYYCTTTSTTATATTTTPSKTSTTGTYTTSTATITTATSTTLTTITTTTPNITLVDYLETDKKAGGEIFLLLLLLLIPCCAAGYFLHRHFSGNADLDFGANAFSLPSLAESQGAADGTAPTAANGVASTSTEWNGASEQLLKFGSLKPSQAPVINTLAPTAADLHASSADSPLHNGARVGSFHSPEKMATPFYNNGDVFIDEPVMLSPLPGVNGSIEAAVSQEEVARLHAASMGYSSGDGGVAGYVMASATPVSMAEIGRSPSALDEQDLVNPIRSSRSNVYAAEQRSNDISAELDPELSLASIAYGEGVSANNYESIVPEGLTPQQNALMVAALAGNQQYRQTSANIYQAQKAINEGSLLVSDRQADRRASSMRSSRSPDAVYQATRGLTGDRRASSMRSSSSPDAVHQARRGSTVSYAEPAALSMMAGPDIASTVQGLNRRRSSEGDDVFENAVAKLQAAAAWRAHGTNSLPRSLSPSSTPTMMAGLESQSTVWDRPISALVSKDSADLLWAAKESNPHKLDSGNRSISYEGALDVRSESNDGAVFQADSVSAQSSRDPVSLAKIGRQATNWDVPESVERVGPAHKFEAHRATQSPAMLAQLGRKGTDWDLPPGAAVASEVDYIDLGETLSAPLNPSRPNSATYDNEQYGPSSPQPMPSTATSPENLYDTIIPLRGDRSAAGIVVPRAANPLYQSADLKSRTYDSLTNLRGQDAAGSRLSSNDAYGSVRPAYRLSSNETYDTIVPLRSPPTRARGRTESAASRLSSNSAYESVMLSHSTQSLPGPQRADSASSRMSANETYEGWLPPNGQVLSASAPALPVRNKSLGSTPDT